ncbi:hypothetical protein PFWH6_0172 [Pseudomonas fluorescens WH6]|nr:hypothetical protein PFWH6_0172 [Pseudomonas fluorescens WH6]
MRARAFGKRAEGMHSGPLIPSFDTPTAAGPVGGFDL